MCLSAMYPVAVSPIPFPSLVLSLLSPFSFFPFLFVFVLLPSVCVLPSSRLFSFFFFQGEGRSAIPSAAGKECRRKGDVCLSFSFVLFSRRGEGKRTVFSFFFSERREGMRSFRFMMKGKEKRTFSVLFSSSASDKRQERKAFIPFFFLFFSSV